MTTATQIKDTVLELKGKGMSNRAIAKELFGKGSSESTIRGILKQCGYKQCKQGGVSFEVKPKPVGPKVLIIDIETCPIQAYVWSLWKQNVGLNQIKNEWHLLSFSAKWLGSPEDEIIYMDQEHIYPFENDSLQLQKLWELLDEADWLISQNGKSFDIKKIRARMVMAGLPPFSPVKHIDTLEIAKRVFGFTSNKLEWMTDKLCTKYKKSKHKNFAGFELWVECMKRNPEAYVEMKEYNQIDVLSLEELYYIISPWSDRLPNPNLHTDDLVVRCICGSEDIVEHGFACTDVSKFQQYKCNCCGKTYRGRVNLLDKAKRKTVLTNVKEF